MARFDDAPMHEERRPAVAALAVIPPMRLSMRKTGLASPAYADRFDCVVYDDGRPIGRIYEDRHALPELRWYWSLTALGSGHAGLPTSGRAPTLEAAKAELAASFRIWLVRTQAPRKAARSVVGPTRRRYR